MNFKNLNYLCMKTGMKTLDDIGKSNIEHTFHQHYTSDVVQCAVLQCSTLSFESQDTQM